MLYLLSRRVPLPNAEAGPRVHAPEAAGRERVPNVEPVVLAAHLFLGPDLVALMFLAMPVSLGLTIIAGLVVGEIGLSLYDEFA